MGERLKVKCIHGNVKEYDSTIMALVVGRVHFMCRVGVVPQLDCPVLIVRTVPFYTTY